MPSISTAVKMAAKTAEMIENSFITVNLQFLF
jgi:hypothetical protein